MGTVDAAAWADVGVIIAIADGPRSNNDDVVDVNHDRRSVHTSEVERLWTTVLVMVDFFIARCGGVGPLLVFIQQKT